MQNRPFYDDRIEETFTATFDGDKSDDTVVTSYGSDYVWVSENTIEDLSIIDSASVNIIINGVENTIDIPNSMWQDVSSVLVGVPTQGALGAVYDEDDKISLVVSLQQNIGQYPKGIYVLANDDLCVMSFTYTTKQGELKQIDSKFIPQLPRTHIRYSAYADGADFTEEWSTGQNYIGYAEAVDAPTDKADYQWSLFASNIRDTLSITLAADAWTNKQQTITTAMIGDDSTVFASPKPSSNDTYAKAGIVLSGATSQSLTFACEVVPTVDIDVEVYVSNPLVIAGVQADCEQNDSTQADYIKNRPVYENVQNLGDTITWDGTPNEDVVTVPLPNTESLTFYRISENTPTSEELFSGRVVFQEGNESMNFNLSDAGEATLGSEIRIVVLPLDESTSVPILVVLYKDNYQYAEGDLVIDVKKKGVYSLYIEADFEGALQKAFIRSLTIPNYNFTNTEIKKLDPKYLPDGGFGYTVKESVKDTLTWDGITGAFTLEEIEAEFEGNVLFYHASNSTPSEEEFTTAEIGMELSSAGEVTRTVLHFDNLHFLQAGEDVSLVVHTPDTSTEHNLMLVAYKDNATAFLGVNITIPQKGIYFLHAIDENDGYSAYAYSLTIPGYTFTKEVVHKIDEKYLPDHLPVVELTTPIDNNFTSFTDAENAALTAAAAKGVPVNVKAMALGQPISVIADNVETALVAMVAGSLFALFPNDDGTWIPSRENFADKLENLNTAVTVLESSLTEESGRIDKLEQNGVVPKATASDNGKFLQVVDGAYALVELQDVSEEGL